MAYTIKIIIVGEPGVGKTSLVKKYISGQFSKDYKASIGTNMFLEKRVIVNDEDTIEISLQLWDIAGQERWINMRRIYYAGTQGALVVGDLTRLRTFDQIEKFWYPDLIKYCGNIPFLLIANKNDLIKGNIKENIEPLKEKLNALSILYTSAKTGTNVKEAFNLISDQIIKGL
ncbi:MAG: Rab family GTPase [Candidatus Hermodarchaeota archaeon]